MLLFQCGGEIQMKLRSFSWQKNLSELYVLLLASYLKDRQEKKRPWEQEMQVTHQLSGPVV